MLHIIYNLHLKSHIIFVPIFCWVFTENLQRSGDISMEKLLEVVYKGEGMRGEEESFG